MFEDRTHKRTFYSAPQSVTSLVAAFLEPTITVLVFIIANQFVNEPMGRPQLTLCLLVFALTFPGPNRFRDNLLSAAVDIVSSWVALLFILALCGYATRSFYLFEDGALLEWAVVTPFAQWLACWAGQHVHRRFNARPEARRAAVVVGADPFFTGERKRIVALAAQYALPGIYQWRQFVRDGGLASYGPDFSEAYRQSGILAGRILRGEKPADLPVQQPTKFELVINIRTARTLGLAIPPVFIARADEIVE